MRVHMCGGLQECMCLWGHLLNVPPFCLHLFAYGVGPAESQFSLLLCESEGSHSGHQVQCNPLYLLSPQLLRLFYEAGSPSEAAAY